MAHFLASNVLLLPKDLTIIFIHPRVLKELAMELDPIFDHLFQQSVDTGEFLKNSLLLIYVPCLRRATGLLSAITAPFL